MKKYSMSFIFILLIFILFYSCDGEYSFGGETDTKATDTGTSMEYSGIGDASTPSQDASPTPQMTIEPGQLTAGEWNDNENWNFWQTLLGQNQDWQSYSEIWLLDTSSRITVQVENEGNPVENVQVSCLSSEQDTVFEAYTDQNGTAYIFESLLDYDGPYTIKAAKNDWSSEQTGIERPFLDPVVFEADSGLANDSSSLDIMFMIDTTGSMADELSYLQSELEDVILKVNQDLQIKSRLSCNFYRDLYDEYTIRDSAFTNIISEQIAFLKQQTALGGGDFPEAVDLALQNAITKHDWNNQAKARLLFLVLDAPPHDYSSAINLVKTMAIQAVEKGIKIIPVTASGIDTETEFLMRCLSVITNGTYVFLTDDSGIGGDHLEPTIGQFELRFLNQLLVDLILEYGGYTD